MGSNIAVLNRGKHLAGPSRARGNANQPVRQGNLPVPGAIQSYQGLQSGGIIPNGTLPAAAPGVNPPSPEPSSFLTPGSVSQTPFPAPLASQQDTGIFSHTTTLFGYTAPTVYWVGGGIVVGYLLYKWLFEEKHRR